LERQETKLIDITFPYQDYDEIVSVLRMLFDAFRQHQEANLIPNGLGMWLSYSAVPNIISIRIYQNDESSSQWALLHVRPFALR
jgi:hypothetical protein